jgi:hypothetical protein
VQERAPRAWNTHCAMAKRNTNEEMAHCGTCPAFCAVPHTDSGTCRAAPPTAITSEESFRGPTRELPFGAFPVVGAFPLVHGDDYCMSHPGNRVKLM